MALFDSPDLVDWSQLWSPISVDLPLYSSAPPPGVVAALAILGSLGTSFLEAQTPADDALYQSGLAAFQARDYVVAEQIFRTLYLDNHDSRGLNGIIETLASQNRMGDAIREVDEAIAAAPDRRDFKSARGNLYARAQRYDEAVAAFKDLLLEEPGSADLLFRLGETYRRKGDINLAADNFRKASQAAPNITLPLIQLALVLETTGPANQAMATYEQILRLDPNNALALNNLAYRRAEEGLDLDAALVMAQRAHQLAPNAAAMADTLGWIYLKKGMPDQAIVNLGEALQKDRNSVDIRNHLAAALDQKNNAPSWMHDLSIALRGDPSAENESRITELLQNIGK